MIERQRCRDSTSFKDAERLPQRIVHDPWPVKKFGCRKDTVSEAAKVLIRARNTELVNECSNAITLLPACGAIPNIQGGSPEKPLYSLRSPTIEPFKFHLWEVPAVHFWNETKGSWTVTAGKIMVRRGLKSEPLTRFIKNLGVTKGKATKTDLCKHFRCWRFLDAHDGWLNEYPRHLRDLVYQIWWSFNGFRFFELPPELREMVLAFAMTPAVVPFNMSFGLGTPNMALSRVSMQLNREVTAALFAHTTFHFHSVIQFLKFFTHRHGKPRIGVMFQPREGLRSLELDLDPHELFPLFGIPFRFDVRNDWQGPLLSSELDALFKDEFPLCNRIRIKMHDVFEHKYHFRPFHCQKLHNVAFGPVHGNTSVT